MSYASVASNNAPPPSAQPRADPALSNTKPGSASSVVDDTGKKVNVVNAGFKEHPATTTAVNRPSPESESEDTGSPREKKTEEDIDQDHLQLWDHVREQLLKPGVAGGLLGVVNVGLLSTFSYHLYTRPSLRTDPKFLGGSAAGALIILGAESFLAEAYRHTESGREEERRAKLEGAALYRHAKEVVLRPNVFGGLIGAVNLGIIGGVSYVAYEKWDRHWDGMTVSAVTIGLLSLCVGEGLLAKQYREKEYPKR